MSHKVIKYQTNSLHHLTEGKEMKERKGKRGRDVE